MSNPFANASPPPASDSSMRLIGTVAFVQIQERSLKTGERGAMYYDPEPLLQVDRLELSEDGVVGVVADQPLVDIHNRLHPQSKSWGAAAGISIGFTSHYERMRRRFGEHLGTGCAGENIVVETDSVFADADLGPILKLRRPDGTLAVRLAQVAVAAPCEPFSRFAGGRSQAPAELRATLQFLHHGMRGYYAVFAGGTGAVQAGDLVYAVAEVSPA